MVLGDVVGVKAAAIIGLGHLQPVFELLREALPVVIDVVEDPEFHALSVFFGGYASLL